MKINIIQNITNQNIKIFFFSFLVFHSCQQPIKNKEEKKKLPEKDTLEHVFTHKLRRTLAVGDTIIIFNGKENGIRKTINSDSLIGVIETDSNYFSIENYCESKYVNGRVLRKKSAKGFHLTTYYFNSKVGYDYSKSILFILDKNKYNKDFRCASCPFEDTTVTDKEVEFIIK